MRGAVRQDSRVDYRQGDAVKRAILSDDFYGYAIPVPDTYPNRPLATEDQKWSVLAAIGIERQSEVTPLQAWRNAVADLNGVTVEQLDLGFTPTYVRRFIWFLA